MQILFITTLALTPLSIRPAPLTPLSIRPAPHTPLSIRPAPQTSRAPIIQCNFARSKDLLALGEKASERAVVNVIGR